MADEESVRAQTLEGMNRAFFHAVDMNRSGELEAEEVEEFRKYIVNLAIDQLGMDDYLAMRDSGELEKLQRSHGHADDVDTYSGQKSREALARKIVASFIDQMYEAGHVDDETYAVEMQKLGIIDAKGREAGKKKWEAGGEEPPIADGALNIWLGQVGLDDMAEYEVPGPEASDGGGGHGMPLSEQYLSPPVQELSAADVAEFKGRQKKRS